MTLRRTKPDYPKARPKVEPFARYRGTSAWHKSRIRMRAYKLFRAAQQRAATPA